MLNRQSSAFLGFFAKAEPGRMASMVTFLFLSRMAEGVGLVTLLPVLELAMGEAGGEQSGLSEAVAEAVGLLGLPATLPVLLGVIVVAMSLKGVLYWFGMRQVGYTVAQVARDLRLRLLRALMDAKWGYFASRPTGNLSNAMSTEANRASRAFRKGCATMADTMQIVVYLGVVAAISWEIGVLGFVGGCVVLYAFHRFIQMSRQAGERTTEVMKSLMARLTDTLPGLKAVKAMGRGEYVFPFLEAETEEINQAQREQVLAKESLRAFQEPGLVLVVAGGLYLALRVGDVPFATVSVLVILAYRVMTTIGNVQRHYQVMTEGESAFWSLMSEIRRAEEAYETQSGGRPPPPLAEGISFDGVSFRYDEARVLDDVSLHVPAHRLTAITGPSGAGKTTFVDLIVGLHEPDAGTIRVDDVPLSEIDLEAWRSEIGYVPQDMLLFHDTVASNVTLGNDSVSRESVREALELAEAWEFVSRLPDGLDEVIGERGSKLSGGQRQRIAIARSLVVEPSLLLLDEATTALNPEIERDICRTLSRLTDSVTVLAISHQSAVEEVADKVLSVEDARIVERVRQPAV